MSSKQIIAFDLSLTNTGYAVGEVEDGQLNIVEVGSINTKRFTKHPHGYRLNFIATEVSKVYKKYPKADAVVKESSFSNGRIRATQIIWKVVGVWELITFIRGHTEHTDIANSTVKKQVAGNGRAKKEQVAEAVAEITGIVPKNHDEADAIAVLLTYCEQNDLIEWEK